MAFLCDVYGPPVVRDRLRPFAGGAGSWARVTENVCRRMAAGGAGQGPGCGSFVGQTPVVDYDGTIYPCVYLAGDRRFSCGSAERGDIDGEARLDGLRERLAVDNLTECGRCPWRSLCGGGVFGAAAADRARIRRRRRTCISPTNRLTLRCRPSTR